MDGRTDIPSDRDVRTHSKTRWFLFSAIGLPSKNQMCSKQLPNFPEEKDLKEIVRIAELAYNTTPHSSTKLSPYFIQFGRNPSIDYFYPQSHQHQQLPQDQLHQKMELYMEIKKRLQATQAKDMYQFNKGKTWSPLKVGQQVLLRRFTTPEGRNRKLLPAFGKIHTITKIKYSAIRTYR